jgi:hypothetical protein
MGGGVLVGARRVIHCPKKTNDRVAPNAQSNDRVDGGQIMAADPVGFEKPEMISYRSQMWWWILGDSNSRHLPCKGSALPTELRTHWPKVSRPGGAIFIFV